MSLALVLLAGGPVACSDNGSEEVNDRARPLQPLVYTEEPDRSPEAEAAREQRLMRELLEGAKAEEGSWGRMASNSDEDRSAPRSESELARTLYRALVEHRDAAWDAAFVSPRRYASLVEVSLEKARSFVDAKQGDALDVRRAFTVDNPSEAPKDGLASIFTVERLDLGEGRTLDGDLADEDEAIRQYWDNHLILSLEQSDVELRVRIPKILRIPPRNRTGSTRSDNILGVASDLQVGPRLSVFLETGMHLKPDLLRSAEYPIPLAVGNYWRYERNLAGTPREREEQAERPGGADSEGRPDRLAATRVTLEVQSIDRFGTRRLIELRWSYNNADLTRTAEHWLATPRRIFLCPRPCRRHVDDLSWLLSYLRRQTPILRIPLERGDTWGGGSRSDDPTYSIAVDWTNHEVPAGSFFGAVEITGVGPLEGRRPFHTARTLTRIVAPGTGVIARRYRFGDDSSETIVESLSDYRLMPR